MGNKNNLWARVNSYFRTKNNKRARISIKGRQIYITGSQFKTLNKPHFTVNQLIAEIMNLLRK